jgi:hypothetical protein
VILNCDLMSSPAYAGNLGRKIREDGFEFLSFQVAEERFAATRSGGDAQRTGSILEDGRDFDRRRRI